MRDKNVKIGDNFEGILDPNGKVLGVAKYYNIQDS